MKLNHLVFILMLLLINSLDLNSQIIRGVVKGKNPDKSIVTLPGARLQWLGASGGGMANSKGEFEIEVPPTSLILEVRAIGYRPDTINIGLSKNYIEVILKSELKTQEVVVEGELPSKIIDKTNIINTEIITERGLKKAACCNLSESFETNASVDVNYTDAITGAKKIMLLGLSGEYTQVLNEKMQMFNGLVTAYGLGYVPGTWIESIQIAKGSSSVTTGYQSMVGQINVEYKKPENLERPLLNLYANSIGRAELNFDITEQISQNLYSTMFVHLNTLQNQIDGNNDGFLDFNTGYQANVMNRWRYDGDGFESQFGAKFLIDDREGGQKAFFENRSKDYFSILNNTKRIELWAKTGIFVLEEMNASLGIITFFSHHNQNVTLGKRLWNAEQNTFNMNIIYDTDVHNQNHKLTTGVAFLYDNFIEDLYSENQVANRQIDTLMKRNELVPGIFMEYTNKTIENLVVIAGIRNDFHNLYGNFFTPRLHLRYAMGEESSIKASIGKGYRVPNVISDNLGMVANNRQIIFEPNIRPEESLNFGGNFLTELELFDQELNISIDAYRTTFQNKLITDMDASIGAIKFYNLDGIAYSNSYQIELSYEPIKRFILNAAYRINDVKSTINGELQLVPMVNRNKTYFNLEYSTEENDWTFDWTININGGGRLPSTATMPEIHRRPDNFNSFTIMNANVGYNILDWYLETYVGVENITNHTQKDPIIDPQNPFKENGHFDAALVYAPIFGRIVYFGIRYKL